MTDRPLHPVESLHGALGKRLARADELARAQLIAADNRRRDAVNAFERGVHHPDGSVTTVHAGARAAPGQPDERARGFYAMRELLASMEHDTQAQLGVDVHLLVPESWLARIAGLLGLGEGEAMPEWLAWDCATDESPALAAGSVVDARFVDPAVDSDWQASPGDTVQVHIPALASDAVRLGDVGMRGHHGGCIDRPPSTSLRLDELRPEGHQLDKHPILGRVRFEVLQARQMRMTGLHAMLVRSPAQPPLQVSKTDLSDLHEDADAAQRVMRDISAMMAGFCASPVPLLPRTTGLTEDEVRAVMDRPAPVHGVYMVHDSIEAAGEAALRYGVGYAQLGAPPDVAKDLSDAKPRIEHVPPPPAGTPAASRMKLQAMARQQYPGAIVTMHAATPTQDADSPDGLFMGVRIALRYDDGEEGRSVLELSAPAGLAFDPATVWDQVAPVIGQGDRVRVLRRGMLPAKPTPAGDEQDRQELAKLAHPHRVIAYGELEPGAEFMTVAIEGSVMGPPGHRVLGVPRGATFNAAHVWDQLRTMIGTFRGDKGIVQRHPRAPVAAS